MRLKLVPPRRRRASGVLPAGAAAVADGLCGGPGEPASAHRRHLAPTACGHCVPSVEGVDRGAGPGPGRAHGQLAGRTRADPRVCTLIPPSVFRTIPHLHATLHALR
eukprot:870318-Pyramimonas_sp.AAC.2